MSQAERLRSTPAREEIDAVIELVSSTAADYLDGLDGRAVRKGGADDRLAGFRVPLPEHGEGATASLRELIDRGLDASVATGGPRCFHFVIGGVTPAALGADWLITALDQVAYAWVTSPLALELEKLSLGWLQELFELPREWGGVMTTGATMANFVGLAAARQWCGERQGVDVAEQGMGAIPPIPVFSSGYVHASSIKALAMLGIGRSSLRKLARDDIGRLDLEATERALAELDGAPAILIGNAGEVNAGDFDPIDALADLAERYNAWLHVDGAFGLFARVSPQCRHLADGVERAHSVTVDGHKWLNVPYDCGFAFVAQPALLPRVFSYSGDYLPPVDDPKPNFGVLGPESSRRARALTVWATLHAYGRAGIRAMVEHNLKLAQRLAHCVDDAPDLERLSDVPLNVVAFRFNPGHADERTLNRLNERLGELIISDGRFYAGTTRYGGMVALRPALVNWRTREQDIEEFVDCVRELGARAAEELDVQEESWD